MKEVSRTATKAAPEAPEGPDVLDEGMREAADEYSRKFLNFIQQEKDKVRKNALDESEKIIADAHAKSRQLLDKALRDAAAESDSITGRARESASVLTSEADRLLKAVATLREKAEKEIEDLRVALRQEAEAVAEAIRQRDQKIDAAHDKLRKEFEASSSIVAELRQRLEQDARIAESVSNRRQAAAAEARTKDTREEPAGRPVAREDDYSKRHSDKAFVGTLNLEVSKGTAALSKRFRESLSKVAGLEISVADDSAKDKTKIVAFASRPLPLLNILHQMSLVKSAVADDDGVRVVLQETDQWLG